MDLAELIRQLEAGTLNYDGMTQLREQLVARLAKPEEGDDLAQLTRAATTLSERISAHNDAATAANSARAALAGMQLAQRSQNGGGSQQRGGVQVLDREDRGAGDDGAQTRTQEPEMIRLGVAFTESDAFQQNRDGLRSGAVSKMSAEIETRALFATSNYPSNFTRIPAPVIQNDQPLTILDLIDRRPISTNSVEWVQEVTAPTGAIEVTEGSAKPESTFSLSLVTDTAATIAHYVNITRQALDDELQLQGYIEGRLSYGLLKRLQAQVLNGNGTAPNLRGILNTVGIGSYTAGGATEAAVISIRKAKTVAQLSEYDPDGLVINPVDWEAVELSADSAGMFRVTPYAPTASSPATLWGLRVVVTTAITGTVFGTTGGTFLVGAFREGATLWERTQVQIFLTDSHASNFISNILTLLAELRAALSVWRPKAFVKGTFGASRT
jgi:HK97 family phage major capsid protein